MPVVCGTNLLQSDLHDLLGDALKHEDKQGEEGQLFTSIYLFGPRLKTQA